MEFDDLIKLVFSGFFGLLAFGMRSIFQKLEDGSNRMSRIEVELARQKQQTDDLHEWMERIDEKLQKIMDNQR